MDKKSKNMAKRILAALLAVMLVSGTAVMTPAYKNMSSSIVVNAVEPSSGFQFSADNVSFTMNGKPLVISQGNESYIVLVDGGENNRKPDITVTDGSTTLELDTDYKVSMSATNDADWQKAGTIDVVISPAGAYAAPNEDSDPENDIDTVQFTFVILPGVGKFYSGEIEDVSSLKAGDILMPGSSFYITNGYRFGLVEARHSDEEDDQNVESKEAFLMAKDDELDREGLVSVGSNDLGADEEDARLFFSYKKFKEYSDPNDPNSIKIFDETKYLSEYPYTAAASLGDAWQVFSNENGVLMLQGVLAPIDISDVFKVESVAPVAYTGEALTPVVVKWKNEEDYESDPVEGEDYFISYENNVEAGVATATIVPADVENYYGTIEKNFEIMALFDLSEVAEEILEIERANGTVVYDKDSDDVSFLTNKVALANLDKVVSRVELQLKPNVASVYVDKEVDANNKVLAIKSPYEYTIHGGNKAKASNVKATHTHVFAGENTANTSVLNLKCLNEYDAPTVKVAELTVKSGEYFYGDHVPIQKKYVDDFDDNPANRYNIQRSDIVFSEDLMYHEKGSSATIDTPTSFGQYSVEARVKPEQIETFVSLFHDFEIKQKPIDQVDIEFSIDNVVQTLQDGRYVVTYNTEEREPSVSLTHKDFYNNVTGEKSDKPLVKDEDYTVTFVPVKAKNANLGGEEVVDHYIVTIEAAYEEVDKIDPDTNQPIIDLETGDTVKEKVYTGNYTGVKTFEWYIDKAEMLMQLNIPETYTYNNDTAYEQEFTVTQKLKDGQETPDELPDDNGSEVDGNGFTIAPYSYKQLVDGQWVELAEAPKVVGRYKAETTVTSQNYITQVVSAEFDIVRAPVTVTPESATITYSQATPVVGYTLEGTVEGGETVPETGLVVVDGEVNGAGVLNAGEYGYKFASDFEGLVPVYDENEENIVGYEYGDNYELTLVNTATVVTEEPAETVELKLVVEPKELTAENVQFAIANARKTYSKFEFDITDDVSMTDIISDVDYSNRITNSGAIVSDYTLSGDVKATLANRVTEDKKEGYVISATGQGNYTGTVELTDKWFIDPKSIAEPAEGEDDFTFSVKEDATYNSNKQEPDITFIDKRGTTLYNLVEESDYVVSPHDDFINANEEGYDFTVEGQGNYCDTRNGKFIINKYPSSNIELSLVVPKELVYDGVGLEERYTVLSNVNMEAEGYEPVVEFYALEGEFNEELDFDGLVAAGIIDAEKVLTPEEVVGAGQYIGVISCTDHPNYDDVENLVCKDVINIAKRSTKIYPDEGQSIEFGESTANVPVEYTFEKAKGDRGVVDADIDAETGKDTVGFGKALKVDFQNNTDVGTYYIYLDKNVSFDNYVIDDLDYNPEFEIVPKKITKEMFTFMLHDGATFDADGNPVWNIFPGADYDPETNLPSVTYTGEEITAAVESDTLVNPVFDADGKVTNKPDYRVSGTTEVFTSSVDFDNNYITEIHGRGNYEGTVTFEWKVDKKAQGAKIIVPEETIYNREAPQAVVATVQSADGQPFPDGTKIELTYWKFNRDETAVTKLSGAPVDAGKYKVTAKITSRNLSISAPDEVFCIRREIVDEDIVIDPNVITRFDFGIATVHADVKVVLNGVDGSVELVKGTDYKLSGTTESKILGKHSVQVSGMGYYFGKAIAEWELTENGSDKDEVIAGIHSNVTVDFVREGEEVDVDAQFLNGKKNILLGLDVSVAEGETYEIVKEGIVYYNGEAEIVTDENGNIGYYNDENEFVALDEKGGKKATRKNSTTYLVPDLDNGIHARAYAVVKKVVGTDAYGDETGYQTTLYSDVYSVDFVHAIKYVTTVTGGEVVGTSAGRAVEITDEEGNGTGVYKVVYHGYDMVDSAKSIKVSAPETIAHEDAEDEKFRGWYADGELVSMYPEYSFKVVNREKNLTAVYVPESEVVVSEPVVTISAVQGIDTQGRDALKFISQYEVPTTEGLPREVGIFVGTNSSLDYTDVAADFDLLNGTLTEEEMKAKLIEKGSKVASSGDKITAHYGTQTANFRADTDKTRYGYAVGYVVRGDGNIVYSKVISASYNLAN